MKDQIGEIVADLYKETLIYATSENASKVNLQAYIDKLETLGGGQAALQGGQPVAYCDPQALINFQHTPCTHEWMWKVQEEGYVPLYTHPPEAMAKDAERYRWLRDSKKTIAIHAVTWKRIAPDRQDYVLTTNEELDAAIDEAMQKESTTTPREQ